MNNYSRWAAIVGALLLAAVVGVMAWNAGVTHGIEQSGKIVVAAPGAVPGPYPYPYPYYGWHRPGGFFFGPLLFLFVFFLILRGIFWRAAWHRGACGAGGGWSGRLDEWHRQAHERMAASE